MATAQYQIDVKSTQASRDHALDRAKGILIILVVFGHLLQATGAMADHWIGAAMFSVYAFHMPAFIFIAGLNMRSIRVLSKARMFILMFVVFQVLYAIPPILKLSHYRVTWYEPYWHLWFLLAIMWWTLLMVPVSRLPAWIAVCAAIAVGLMSGLCPLLGNIGSLSRTLVFLPFVVTGHVYGRVLISAVRRAQLRWILSILWSCLIVFIGFVFLWQRIPLDELSGFASFSAMHVDRAHGLVWRSEIYLVGFVMTMGVIAVAEFVPFQWLEKVGSRSLSIFLFHVFFVMASSKFLVPLYGRFGAIPTLIAVSSEAILLSILIGRRQLESLARATGNIWPSNRVSTVHR